MSQFREGDKVRLKLTGAYVPMYWRSGDTGVVTKAYPKLVVVKMDREGTIPVSWDPAHLELVEKTKAEAPRILPEDDAKRREYPLYDGLMAYFPAALCEVSRWSLKGNIQHNGPDAPLHWAREKSTDHENKILRHLLDARKVDKDGFPEAVALAWRALALCQTILEENGWAEGANARRLR